MSIARAILAIIGAWYLLALTLGWLFVVFFGRRRTEPRDGEPFADLDEERW